MLSHQARNGLDIGPISRPGIGLFAVLYCYRRLSNWPVDLVRHGTGNGNPNQLDSPA